MDTFLLGVLVEYPNIINRINNKTKGKKCVVTNNVTVENSDYWVSYIKAGHGNFITLRNVELKLSGK